MNIHGRYDHELVYAFGYRVLPLRFAHHRNECWPWRRVTQAYSDVTVYNLEGKDKSFSSGTKRRNSSLLLRLRLRMRVYNLFGGGER